MKPTMELRWVESASGNPIINGERRQGGMTWGGKKYKLQQLWVGVNIETGENTLEREWRDIELMVE